MWRRQIVCVEHGWQSGGAVVGGYVAGRRSPSGRLVRRSLRLCSELREAVWDDPSRTYNQHLVRSTEGPSATFPVNCTRRGTLRIAESSLFAEQKEVDWDRDVTNVLYVVRLHFPSKPTCTVRLSDSGLTRPRIPDNRDVQSLSYQVGSSSYEQTKREAELASRVSEPQAQRTDTYRCLPTGTDVIKRSPIFGKNYQAECSDRARPSSACSRELGTTFTGMTKTDANQIEQRTPTVPSDQGLTSL